MQSSSFNPASLGGTPPSDVGPSCGEALPHLGAFHEAVSHLVQGALDSESSPSIRQALEWLEYASESLAKGASVLGGHLGLSGNPGADAHSSKVGLQELRRIWKHAPKVVEAKQQKRADKAKARNERAANLAAHAVLERHRDSVPGLFRSPTYDSQATVPWSNTRQTSHRSPLPSLAPTDESSLFEQSSIASSEFGLGESQKFTGTSEQHSSNKSTYSSELDWESEWNSRLLKGMTAESESTSESYSSSELSTTHSIPDFIHFERPSTRVEPLESYQSTPVSKPEVGSSSNTETHAAQIEPSARSRRSMFGRLFSGLFGRSSQFVGKCFGALRSLKGDVSAFRILSLNKQRSRGSESTNLLSSSFRASDKID